MSLQVDAEVLQEMVALRADAGQTPLPAVGDVAARRANAGRIFGAALAVLPPVVGVDVKRYSLTADDGTTLELSWYFNTYFDAAPDQPGSAVLYLHGGGMILGLSELGGLYDYAVRRYVSASAVPMLVVDYRVAPEVRHPVPVEDGYAALRWLVEHAAGLAVDPARVAVMGDSAGGGLAAGVCLLARDRGGPAIAQQLLIYPMLDDRTSASSANQPPLLTWSYDDNITGWSALLGDSVGTATVSPYAAPARATDLTGLPPSYIDIGDLDIFCDEDLVFARRLMASGVSTELHLYPGCPHAFEWLAPSADVSKRAVAQRIRRLRSL